MKKIKIIQIDGKLPNLALMKLSAWHRSQGDQVDFTRSVTRDMFEPEYNHIYASSIFKFSAAKQERVLKEYPTCILSGTGTNNTTTVESIIGNDFNSLDYSIYPEYHDSIGFSQRGCRMKCPFCVVPSKEGKVKSTNSISGIYRGTPYPKNIMLLDNDFFGQKNWREKIAEITEGNYKVCFSQGINVRLINNEIARSIATIKYFDTKFKRRRLYTAWDNLRDEKKFLSNINILIQHGIRPRHILVYMLIGYLKDETWESIFYRLNKMIKIGLLPFPMVYDHTRKDLKKFQRWVVRGYYRFIPWEEFNK